MARTFKIFGNAPGGDLTYELKWTFDENYVTRDSSSSYLYIIVRNAVRVF